MNLTNRDLEKAFKKSLVQIKRWAGLCLGSDPLAGQGGGVRREYDRDSAFIIYLFGIVLVGEFHLELKEAKIHLDNITPVLRVNGLLPSKLDPRNQNLNYMPSPLIHKSIEHKSLMGASIPNLPLLPRIDLTIMPGYKYLLERSILVYLGSVNDDVEYQAFTYQNNFPKGGHLEIGPHYYIPLLIHIQTFNNLISEVL